ncbi:hypothetical protein ATER59S_01610 [Aquamicrobium terrae]
MSSLNRDMGMNFFSNLSDSDLEKQVASLSRELASLKKVLARRGSCYYEDGRDMVSDFSDDLAERIGSSLPAVRRQARAIERSAREHPATAAAIGLVALGLAAMFLIGRR